MAGKKVEPEIVLRKSKRKGKRPSREVEQALMEQRRGQVAILMKGAMSFKEIADSLGVAPSTITEDVKALRLEWAQRRRIVDDEFDLDLARLDDGIRGIYVKYRGGSLETITVMLKILERRAKMLAYDRPPPKQEFGISGRMELEQVGDDLHLLTDIQIENLIIELAKKEGLSDADLERMKGEANGDDTAHESGTG